MSYLNQIPHHLPSSPVKVRQTCLLKLAQGESRPFGGGNGPPSPWPASVFLPESVFICISAIAFGDGGCQAVARHQVAQNQGESSSVKVDQGESRPFETFFSPLLLILRVLRAKKMRHQVASNTPKSTLIIEITTARNHLNSHKLACARLNSDFRITRGPRSDETFRCFHSWQGETAADVPPSSSFDFFFLLNS
jgi:hypothetical protein